MLVLPCRVMEKSLPANGKGFSHVNLGCAAIISKLKIGSFATLSSSNRHEICEDTQDSPTLHRWQLWTLIWAVSRFRRILGTVKYRCRICFRYIKTPRLWPVLGTHDLNPRIHFLDLDLQGHPTLPRRPVS